MKVLKRNPRQEDGEGGKPSDSWLGPYTIYRITNSAVFLTNEHGKKLLTGVNKKHVKVFHEEM
jgi:hypothetical protein